MITICHAREQINRVFYEANKFSIHAEKSAIIKIKNKHILKKCKIYIAKIKDGKIQNAAPCIMCSNLLKKYNITNICDFK